MLLACRPVAAEATLWAARWIANQRHDMADCQTPDEGIGWRSDPPSPPLSEGDGVRPPPPPPGSDRQVAVAELSTAVLFSGRGPPHSYTRGVQKVRGPTMKERR